MVASAGTIEAQLILNASQFHKGMQSAMATAQGMGKSVAGASQVASNAMGSATSSMQKYTNSVKGATTQSTYMGQAIGGAVNQLGGMTKAVNTASSSFSNMGNAYKTAITPIQSNTSKISSAFSSLGSSGAAAFGKVGSGIMTAGNALANLTNSFVNFNVWMGALVGKLFYDFTIGAAMAVEESKSLFTFVGMSATEVDRLDKATASYAASASKVSQPEMLNSWKLIRVSQKLSADEMIQYQGVLGDTIGLFKTNGRTAEDAGRAIEDAMAGGSDGIRRLKEIGISDMQELYDRGFDPSKPATFFAALQKLYQDRGVEGYANKVTSLADRFENLKEKIQLAGVAAGEVLMPGMEAIVNALTTVFEGLGPTVSGVIIAFTGLSIILGFFWPTLVTIGSALTMVAARMFAAAGATAVYGAAMAGPGNAGTVSLLQSLKSIPPATIAATIGLVAMAAALIGLTYAISQAKSSQVAWNNAEAEQNNIISTLTKNKDVLSQKISDLTTKRAEEAASGRDTAEIDREIAKAKADAATNTVNLDNAEATLSSNRELRAAVESSGKSRIESSKTSAAAAQAGMTPEEYVAQTGGQASFNDALLKTAELYRNIQGPYDKQAGTIDRINKGQDTYAKIMKSNKNVFGEYKKDYDDYAKSSENFFLAMEKGDIGGMIKEGVMSGFFQLKLGLVETKVSIMSWAEDTGNAIKKPFQDAYVSIQNWWNGIGPWFGGLGARLGQLWGETTSYIQGAWNNTVLFFQGGAAWIQGAWGNTVAFFQGAWNNTVNTIMNGWNWLTSTIGNISIGVTSWGTWVFNWLVEQYNWVKSILSNPISLVVSGAAGMNAASSRAVSIGQTAAARLQNSSGPINLLKTAMNGLGYQNYSGHQKTPAQVIADGCGNCVDLSLTAAALGSGMGIRSELMLGSWNGGGHAWGRYNGQQLDFSRKVLQNTYIPPARGPGGSNGAYYDLRGATILDGPSFEKMIEKTNNKMVRRY